MGLLDRSDFIPANWRCAPDSKVSSQNLESRIDAITSRKTARLGGNRRAEENIHDAKSDHTVRPRRYRGDGSAGPGTAVIHRLLCQFPGPRADRAHFLTEI